MSLFTPGNRRQTVHRPLKPQPPVENAVQVLERWVKGVMFGCRMCGNCLLQETAFICPMNCPKGLRNGPCGGSSSEQCYVDERYPCIWYKIYERSFNMGREDMLLEVLPPLDWREVGTDTWIDVVKGVRDVGTGKFISAVSKKETRPDAMHEVFHPIRQPDWWQGDSEYHAPAYEEPVSELERRLKAGEFVVAAEIAPPLTTATGKLKERIAMLKPHVSAINFTDNASATPRMSSSACSTIAIQEGAEPVLQITARDHNRTRLQADVVGMNAVGVRNVLAISGDHANRGPSPMSNAGMVDLDSIQMLWVLRRLRDEGQYMDGRKLKFPPKFFLGSAASPLTTQPRFQALREHKKINAGAQFFQTNVIFDPDGIDPWIEALDERDLLDKVHILIGITPLKSFRMAQYMHEQIPGVTIPQALRDRLENAGDGVQEEGFNIAMEIVEAVKGKAGVNGIHIMAVGWEEIVPRIVEEAGLAKKN